MKLYLKTITPVHIGTGKQISQFEYYNNYRINFDKLFSLLSEEKSAEFFTWIDDINANVLSVKDIIKKFNLNEKLIISRCAVYRFNNILNGNIKEGIKDSENKFIVPGSSIKGAIRTALMYAALKNNPDFVKSELQKILRSIPNDPRKKDQQNVDELLDQEVLICGVFDSNKNKIVYNDQKYDLLKLLTISDTSSVSTHEQGEVSNVQLYALGNVGNHRNIKINTESISDEVTLEFDIKIGTKFLIEARKRLLDKDEKMFGKEIWFGIEKKVKNLFNVDLKNENDEINEEKIIKHILNALFDFGGKTSQLEKQWLSSLPTNQQNQNSELVKLYKLENKFKLGFASGFSGTTILSLLLSDQNLKSITSDIYKKFDIGLHGNKKKNNTQPLSIDKFPFTRRCIKKNGINGFGWCTIQTNKTDDKKEMINNITKAEIKRESNWTSAEIIQDKVKPYKVKVLDGDHAGKETTLAGVTLAGFGLSKGSKVYVVLALDKKKNLQKADYKDKIN